MDRPRVIRVHPQDNVAIVVNDGGLRAGARIPDGPVLPGAVPQGHKLALVDLAAGDPIRRYGVVIAHAARDLPAGAWVNEHNTVLPAAPALDDLPLATVRAPQALPVSATFQGYRNPDGSVGTRNLLAVTTTVQCVAGVVEHAVRRIRDALLPRYPNVDGVVALDHVYGCGVAIDAPDAAIPIRTLANIARNPNFGGRALVVSLGCEKLQPARLDLPEAALVTLQEQDGFGPMLDAILSAAETQLEALNARRRETCPVSELVVGLQCGGSDAFSGVTANPALGLAADRIVRAGGTVLFSENTEVRDGIAQLTARAATPEIAREIIRELDRYDAYLARGGVDRSANTTPGNKAGGLSNIVEKAMGSIVKSGSAPIAGVVPLGARAEGRGLLYAATPASDFICGTLQLAAGATVHVFTTGRGTPYSLEALPTIKVATRSDLARRWHDLMDINAGTVATGETSLAEMGRQVFDHILAVASGAPTWGERHRLHNALALFNPAPVT
ncbi:galactarate dehydratase [Pseudoponticoccus marisrubri]|uniref:Galactarate dehydratase n=1 Tax=Pseudoponticoccus marisrubri TaxID=1685382 RepID=A0A0W7WM62_9RHOB|nr:galactarate dehydratase [Pseudoponticoccus marisrubri]